MKKSLKAVKRLRQKNDEMFVRAAEREEQGDLKGAFRLYLAGAKGGDSGCQVNVGNFYDDGTGVRRNRLKALYWYKRAYRRGDASAAHNIGILWRNESKHERALNWFRKAVTLGDDEANLEIAKYYLQHELNPKKAIFHLTKVCESNSVSEAGAEEAALLLEQIREKTKKPY